MTTWPFNGLCLLIASRKLLSARNRIVMCALSVGLATPSRSSHFFSRRHSDNGHRTGAAVACYEYFLFNEGLLSTAMELHQADNNLARVAGMDLLARMPHCTHVEIYKRQRRIDVLMREDSHHARPGRAQSRRF